MRVRVTLARSCCLGRGCNWFTHQKLGPSVSICCKLWTCSFMGRPSLVFKHRVWISMASPVRPGVAMKIWVSSAYWWYWTSTCRMTAIRWLQGNIKCNREITNPCSNPQRNSSWAHHLHPNCVEKLTEEGVEPTEESPPVHNSFRLSRSMQYSSTIVTL